MILPTNHKLIGIGYKRRSGKDTVAKMIKEHPKVKGVYDHVEIINFSDFIIDEAEWMLHGEKKIKENKDTYTLLLQWLGWYRRKEIPSFWTDKIEDHMNSFNRFSRTLFIVCGVRYWLDCVWAKKLEGKLLLINRDVNKRTDNHISETELDNYNGWDWEIDNNSTLADLSTEVHAFVSNML